MSTATGIAAGASSAGEKTPPSYQMYIDSEWVGARSGATMAVTDPASEEVVAHVPNGGVDDAQEAIAAARRAFDEGPWPRRTPLQRANVLRAAAALVRERSEELARLETRQMGKLLDDARYDMADVAHCLDHAAGLATSQRGQQVQIEAPQGFGAVLREPIGVVVGITPWNFPLVLGAWKFASALAAGNVMIVKPASISPLTTIEMARIFAEVDLPRGVFQVVVGPGSTVGNLFSGSPLVDMVTLTGSLEVGVQIMRQAAGTVKKVGLELGGKSPNIVFEDAKREAALQGALFGAFANAGQVCCAGSRLLVQRSIYDGFVAELVRRARAIKVGPGLEPDSAMGPLVSRDQLERTEEYVRIGRQEGAKLLCGGKRIERAGFFYQPTIFGDVDNSMRIAQEEIFGPVLVVIPFETEEEAVAIANDTIYGLAGGVWTQDVARALRVVRAVRAGTMYVNTYNWSPIELPWGGYKQSGLGRELGSFGLKEFTEAKSVIIDTSGEPLGLYAAVS